MRLIQISTVVTLHVANEQRAQVAGWLSAVLLTAQGLGAFGAGVLGLDPFAAVAVAGVAGVIGAVPVALAWRRR